MVKYEQDFIMRQIQMLVRFVSSIIFGRDSILEEMDKEQAGEMGELYTRLNDLLSDNDICTAEDELLNNFTESKDYLRLTLWFYNELSTMTDEELESANFSREEIYEGLQNVLQRSGISPPPF